MVYSVRKLADAAGVSVRTLHFYDEIGLLRPESYSGHGYRCYGENDAARLQQIMFFREMGFTLAEIKTIMSQPDYNMLDALESHRTLLKQRAARLAKLLNTVDKTISGLKGEKEMGIKDYYEGFSDEKMEKYRQEVRERWGEKTLQDSEARLMQIGKDKFKELQAEGGQIFKTVADNMALGPESRIVQSEIGKWRAWLENFSHYEDESVLGLGRAYSQDPRFAAFFKRYGEGMPEFFTRAVEVYCQKK